jgi:hypothetical protein
MPARQSTQALQNHIQMSRFSACDQALSKPESTVLTRDVVEKLIVALSNNRSELARCRKRQAEQNFFEIFQNFLSFLLPRTVLKGYLNET